MKKRILFPMLTVVLALALTIPMALVSAHEEEDPYVTDLLAGQTEDVGDVKVWNDGDNLYITYEITELDWIITKTHLYLGKNVAPTTAPGQFPYDDDDASSVSDTTVTYTIPLDDIDSYSRQLNKKGKPTGVMVADGSPGVEPCNEIYIAAHAEVQKVEIETSTITTTETAWGEGFRFEGRNNWAMHFPYHVQAVPCMTPSGELTVTGTGWYNDTSPATAWCPCAYTYDLTDAGEPIALQGWVDLSEAAVANTGDWSKYYAKFSMFDSVGKAVQVVFNNDWLGPWYEMPAQQWDRIRMENNMSLPMPERHYAIVGGTLGYDMDGYWVGPGNGATVYPSDGNYFFQLIADPVAETFTLQVYGMGSGAPAADPPPSAKPGWPKQNMYDDPTWLELGTITATGFDFSEVTICAELWASTQAGAEETTTIYWDGMTVDTPVTFGDIPE